MTALGVLLTALTAMWVFWTYRFPPPDITRIPRIPLPLGYPYDVAARLASEVVDPDEGGLPGTGNGAITDYLMGTHEVERMEELLDWRCGIRACEPMSAAPTAPTRRPR